MKVTETDENGINQKVDGKWLIPNEDAIDSIETAFQVLGLRLDNTQLWKSDSSGFGNVIKTLSPELRDEQLWTTDGKGTLSKDYSFLGISAL